MKDIKLSIEDKIRLTEEFNIYKKDHLNEDVLYKSFQYWLNLLKNNYSVINDIFTGLFLVEIECLNCKNKSFNFESSSVMTLELINKMKRSSSTTLNQCLDSYCAAEKLTGDEQYDCVLCKKKTDAIINRYLWYVPDRFIIHLKRFDNNGSHTSKNSTCVEFPITDLNLEKYIAPYKTNSRFNNNYNLYGVVCHSGSLNGGHYTAYTKNIINGKWYEFNDSTVIHVPNDDIKNEVVTSDAYILFYEREKTNVTINKIDSDESDN